MDVQFCKRCVISNQRPNSAAEFKHTSGSKKETIHFDAEGVCDHCRRFYSTILPNWHPDAESRQRLASPSGWKKVSKSSP